MARKEVKNLQFQVKESGSFKVVIKNTNVVNVLNQSFHVSYNCEKYFKGDVEDIVPNKIWIKNFKFREEQVPSTLNFQITSQSMIGFSVNYNISIYQEYDKMKEENGRITSGDYTLQVKVPVGIYRVFVENKSILPGQNMQLSIKSSSYSVIDAPLKIGDKSYASTSIVVLSRQEPMDLSIVIKPFVKDENIRIQYGVVIAREFDSKKKVMESEKRINFRATFAQMIDEKNINQLSALYKHELLKDKVFWETMADLLNNATEVFHQANNLVGKILVGIERNNLQEVQQALINAHEYDPKKFTDLEKAIQDAFVFIQKWNEKAHYVEELMNIVKKGPCMDSLGPYQRKKQEAILKLGTFFAPCVHDLHDQLIFERLDDFEKKLSTIYEKDMEKRRREKNLVLSLERIMFVGELEQVEAFVNENKNDLPPDELKKACEYIESQKPKDHILEEKVKLQQDESNEKFKKYQLDKEMEEKERILKEEATRLEQIRIFEQEKVRKENEERTRKENEDIMRKQSEERIRREMEQRKLADQAEKERLDEERRQKEKVEMEDRIRKEIEAKFAQEYEVKLRNELGNNTPILKKVQSDITMNTTSDSDKGTPREPSTPTEAPKQPSPQTMHKSTSLNHIKDVSPTTHTPTSHNNSPHLGQTAKLPSLLDNLHKGVISLIRLSSVQTNSSFEIRRQYPFQDDVDTVMDCLFDFLDQNRSISYFFKTQTSVLEIAKRVDPKMMNDFFNHDVYRKYQKEQNKFLNEVRLLLQFILHHGHHKTFFQNLIKDQKLAGSLYTSSSLVRNEQFRDEMIITFDLLGQLKFGFDAFDDELDVQLREQAQISVLNETPLPEPISIPTKKAKKKKNHAILLKNIKLSANKILEYYIQESKNRSMNDVGNDQIVTEFCHDMVAFVICLLKNGFKDEHLDLWTTLTIIVNSSTKKDELTKKYLVNTFHEIEGKDVSPDEKIHVFFALIANSGSIVPCLQEISSSNQIEMFYKPTCGLKSKVSMEKLYSYLTPLDKLPKRIALFPQTKEISKE